MCALTGIRVNPNEKMVRIHPVFPMWLQQLTISDIALDTGYLSFSVVDSKVNYIEIPPGYTLK